MSPPPPPCIVVRHAGSAVLLLDGWRNVYPVRRELGVVHLLETEADVKSTAGVATLRRHVGKRDHFRLGPFNNVRLEAALVEFVLDLAQGGVHNGLSATGVRPDFSVRNSLYSPRLTMSSDLNSRSGSSDCNT